MKVDRSSRLVAQKGVNTNKLDQDVAEIISF
jgi:hypothetical protein